MKKIILSTILIKYLFGIGVETLNIPPTAGAAGSSGAGIASPGDIWINPAAIHNIENTHVQFTYFRWLGGIPGNQIAINWKSQLLHHLAIESSTINDLDLYGEIPEAEPLGKFSTSWISAVYGVGLNFGGTQSGILVRVNYSRLYTETMTGITVDYGSIYSLNKKIGFGLNIKNLGFEASDNMRTVLPLQIGGGISITEPVFSSLLLFDVIQDKVNGTIFRTGIRNHFGKLTTQTGATFQGGEFIAGSGISYHYRNWKISWSALVHSRTVLGIPQYLDIAWYF